MPKFKILIIIFLLFALFSCFDSKSPRFFYEINYAITIKDGSHLKFKAKIAFESKKEVERLKKRHKKINYSLYHTFKVLIAKQIKTRKKVESALKQVMSRQTKKPILDIEILEFNLNK